MKVTILTYVDRERSRGYDAVVDQVAAALAQRGHKPSVLAIHKDLQRLLTAIGRQKPDLIFNLMEMFHGDVKGEIGIAGLLDLIGIPYTGGGPGEFYLQQDKALAKRLLAFDGVPYPHFAVFEKDAGIEMAGKLQMPLFVKPLCGDASIGIDQKSLVRNTSDLMKRIIQVHETTNDSALAEQYIEGREFYVGVLGNEKPVAFPPVEMDFSELPQGKPHLLDAKAKWVPDSVEFKGTRSMMPDLPKRLRANLEQVSLKAYRALRVRDYGRVDLRMSEAGKIFVIEVNASCYLERSSEFASAAAAAGLDYPSLIERILQLARDRHQKRTGKRRQGSVV
jgi:D-alanine-D-alanine ligase